jgi:hypothetical protein
MQMLVSLTMRNKSIKVASIFASTSMDNIMLWKKCRFLFFVPHETNPQQYYDEKERTLTLRTNFMTVAFISGGSVAEKHMVCLFLGVL